MGERESAKLAQSYIQSLKEMGRRFSPGEKNAIYLSECAKTDDRDQVNQGFDYSDQQARLAAMHARHDIAGVYGYSAYIARRVSWLLKWNLVLTVLLVLILLRGH